MNVCWGGGSRLEREVSALQGAARGLYRLRLRGQWFSGEAHYYLSAKHLWPAWPPASQRSPHPCPALGRLRGPGALEARAHPAFLGGPLKARSCWGHSAPDSRRDPHTPSPISCSGHTGWGQPGAGGPSLLARQSQAAPGRASSVINSRGTLSGPNLLGAEGRPGSGPVLSACSRWAQTGPGNH